MPQIFHPITNTFSRISILGAVLIIGGIVWIMMVIVRSPYVTQAEVARDQPVPFSHQHHVEQIGIDCRFCHTSVEDSPFAGIPATDVCMGCHSQIWSDSPMLEPVRVSLRENRPLRWTRVHDLPDYSYFDHSVHLARGIGCSTCHGAVEKMPLMWRASTLHMEWCLDCHRHPAPHVRPADQIFAVDWRPPDANSVELQAEDFGIAPATTLTNCSICHR